MNLRDIPLARVAWRNRRCSFSRGGDRAALEASIRRAGLLDPPDLFPAGGRWGIVAGRRRLEALRALGRRTATARIHPAGAGLFPLWRRHFFDRISRRRLNPAEACTVVAQLTGFGLDDAAISREYLPFTGLPPREGEIDRARGVARLPEALLDALAAGEVTYPTAAYLAGIPPRETRAVFRFLRARPLTASRQRELVRLLADLAARDGLSPGALCAAAARGARGRPGRPGEASLQLLRERRYPVLSARRAAWKALRRSLSLPPAIDLSPTHPFFERDGLAVRLTARDRREYARLVRLLAELGEHPDFGRLFTAGGGDDDG